MPSSYLILCRPLLSPWIFPSLRVFFNESVLGTEKASFTDVFYLLFLERRGEIRMAFSYLLFFKVPFSSVQFSCSVVSDSLRPCGLQHARPPYLSPTPRTCSNLCPLSQWSHPAVSSSVIPFSSCPPNPPSIRVFSNESALRMRWPKYWSFSFNTFLPVNTQDWSPVGWTGWISLQSKGLSRVFSNTTVQKHQFFSAQPSSQSNSHIHTDYWKNHSLD